MQDRLRRFSAPGMGCSESTTIRYDLTTNVRGAILEVALHSSAPSDVSVKVLAGSTYGSSEGTVELRPDGQTVPVVTRIQPGLENGQVISLSADGVVASDLTQALTLRDPVSGASQTVETRF